MALHCFLKSGVPVPDNLRIYESPAQRAALLALGWVESTTVDLLRGDVSAQIASELAAANAPTVTTAPTIAGAAAATTVGTTFTVTPGAYAGTPAPTIARAWYKDGTAITPAETGTTLDSTGMAAAARLTCVETATNASGSIQSTSNEIVLT